MRHHFRRWSGLLLLASILGCSKSTAPQVAAIPPSMTVVLSLEPPVANAVSISKINFTVSAGGHSTDYPLTVDGDKATLTIKSLAPGRYSLAVQIYDGATLLASGRGDASVAADITSAVTIEIAYSSGIEIIGVWSADGSNAPVLISPAPNAVLDNGCLEPGDGVTWDFDWSDAAGATEYQLYVKNLGALHPVIDMIGLTSSAHHSVCSNCYVTDHNSTNWRWRVRAKVSGAWGNWSAERSFSVEPLSKDCPGTACYPGLPSPRLAFTGTRDYVKGGTTYREYMLAVTNWAEYPVQLFTPAPTLPPCGLNTSASRTWIEIFRADGRRLYGYCGISDPAELQYIGFALPVSESPTNAYAELIDRQCQVTLRSNTVSTGASAAPEILVDASHDGGGWWFPQSAVGGFSSVAYHQGQALANRLRGRGFKVAELPRGTTITSQLLGQYDKVIRAGNYGYSSAEIAAYVAYVNRPEASLVLISELLGPSRRDDLAEALGLKFRGLARGQVAQFTSHAITNGASAFDFNAGAVLLDSDLTQDIEVLGRLRSQDFADLNGNEIQDPGEPTGSAVMGVLHTYSAKVFFLGEINGIEGVPQPLVDNLTTWAFGTPTGGLSENDQLPRRGDAPADQTHGIDAPRHVAQRNRDPVLPGPQGAQLHPLDQSPGEVHHIESRRHFRNPEFVECSDTVVPRIGSTGAG